MLHTEITGVQFYGLANSLPTEKRKSTLEGEDFFVSAEEQTTSDLGYNAANRLIAHLNIPKEAFGFLLFSSKTPDYRSPITAAVLQARLEFPVDCICYDVNLGNNAFIQMIQLGASVLKNQNKKYGLLIFGDTPSKLRSESPDRNFEISDAATAIVLKKSCDTDFIHIQNITAGDKYQAHILRSGGFRDFSATKPFDSTDLNNFVVREKEELFKEALQVNITELMTFSVATDQVFWHSSIAKRIKNHPKEVITSNLLANASELPMSLVERIHQMKEDSPIGFCSTGEGIALFMMRINHKPICIETTHTNEFFADYQVSHEM